MANSKMKRTREESVILISLESSPFNKDYLRFSEFDKCEVILKKRESNLLDEWSTLKLLSVRIVT